jgi:tetratricopeptide (TPR) repeat protein
MEHARHETRHRQDAEEERKPSLWNRAFEWKLRSRRSALIFLAALIVPGLVLVFETGRVVLAQTLGDSFNAQSIRHAIALDPANPDPRFELGKILLLTGDPEQQLAAEEQFRTATEMNRNSAVYWSGLAAACYAVANQACADDAFTRAQELAPSNPIFSWQAAVNDVVSNQPQAAVRNVKTFLRLQPDGLTQSFQLLTRGFDNPELIWRDLLGNNSDTRVQVKFLEFLAAANRADAADGFWRDMAAQKKAVSIAEVTPYIDQLLANGHYTEAANVWSYARAQRSANYADALSEPNLVFNGSFEREPLNAGFDWRHAQQPYVELSFSDPMAQSGRRALGVDFTIPQNADYDLLYQFVPVEPNHTYELSAFFKAQGITSDSGPRLRVLDPRCQACLDVATDGPTGTTDWRRVDKQFSTGPTTDIIRLSLWRPRSRTYPTEIAGQLWLDDVSLVKAEKQ